MEFNTKSITVGGDKYTIKEINARQRQQLFKLFKDETDPVEAQAHSIKMGCAEFADKTIDEIFEMPGSIFAKLADEVMKISGLGDESETEKNS